MVLVVEEADDDDDDAVERSLKLFVRRTSHQFTGSLQGHTHNAALLEATVFKLYRSEETTSPQGSLLLDTQRV